MKTGKFHYILFSLLYMSWTLPSIQSRNWAVLVAGSKGWENYRHQAAVSHAYQVLVSKGFPKENIITMMYDDIAHNDNNPYPGEIFTDYSHKNRYEGITVDYKGEDVTVENFLGVLEGSSELKAKNRKVLQSGPEDDIFIFFSDHGSINILLFPNGTLHARTLNTTLTNMFLEKKYKKMVLYIEACESGSMFQDILSSEINVYVTTSANPREPSHACFCHDPIVDACLCDQFSVVWTADSESHNLSKWTLDQQYESIRTGTTQSHPEVYGDLKIGSMNVAEFQGERNSTERLVKLTKRVIRNMDTMPSRKAHLVPLYRELQRSNSNSESKLAHMKMALVLHREEMVRKTFEYIEVKLTKAEVRSTNLVIRNMWEKLECFEKVYNKFQEKCFSIQKYPEVAEHLHTLDKACKQGIEVRDIFKAMDEICV